VFYLYVCVLTDKDCSFTGKQQAVKTHNSVSASCHYFLAKKKKKKRKKERKKKKKNRSLNIKQEVLTTLGDSLCLCKNSVTIQKVG